MASKDTQNVNNILALIVVGAFILSMIAAGVTIWQRKTKSEKPSETPAAAVPIEKPDIIEYKDTQDMDAPPTLTEQRKAELGVEKGVDLLVKAGESMKIGDAVVPMKDILNRIKLKRGDIVESDLGQTINDDALLKKDNGAKDVYGIYVVKPKDNIWNIHFRFLQDYFEMRGVTLSPTSDEATSNGVSSGVGKILKFSENMVYIYNIRDKRLDVDLNLIHPLTKIVVFDMGKVLTLLEQISYGEVNRIQFDGETLWIPTKQ